MRHLGYLAAVVLAVLGLVVLFAGGTYEAAVSLVVVSLVITVWQRSHNQRIGG